MGVSTFKIGAVIILLAGAVTHHARAWGFYAHKKINRQAVFSLPPELIGFFKTHITYISENAVNPDRRRYAVKGEAEKHYLDADAYGDSAIYYLPRYWSDAVEQYGEEHLRAHGIAPWSTYQTFIQLVRAMEAKDTKAILRLTADLGHYIGDIHVPLHTTMNYNGQLTGQYGIHGFWESRIPELFHEDYDFLVGRAEYVEDPLDFAWEVIEASHNAVDSVLRIERELNATWPTDLKYTIENRGQATMQVYSREYSAEYQKRLGGQIERRMRASVHAIGSLWYTAWVNAGQPDLRPLYDKGISPEEQEQMIELELQVKGSSGQKGREHEN
jgi:hypothetical protein